MPAFLCLCLSTLLLGFASAGLSLAEYSEAELENPENVLYLRTDNEQHIYYPRLERLLFVTPWSKSGYDWSVKYARKFAYVSPCWYTFQLSKDNRPIFEHQHDRDNQYLISLRSANSLIKILPRVYLDANQAQNFMRTLAGDQNKYRAAVDMVKRIVDENDYDGVVWDSPFNMFDASRSEINRFLQQFIAIMKGVLGSRLVFFNIANPHSWKVSPEAYGNLNVDGLLIQNYDRDNPEMRLLMNSLEWVRGLNPRLKVIMLLPFFTRKEGTGSISSQEALKSLLSRGVNYAWVEKDYCVLVEDKTMKKYQMPCNAYFSKAFQLCDQAQVAVGFWEGGNGLQNYYTFL